MLIRMISIISFADMIEIMILVFSSQISVKLSLQKIPITNINYRTEKLSIYIAKKSQRSSISQNKLVI